jgi:hypothetical protein
MYILKGEAEFRTQKWKSRTGELMVGFPDLPGGGVQCSMSYFTLLPIQEGGTLQAGSFYEYSGTFIAPLDSASLSMTVGYGQHVWVDYMKVDILHAGAPREYECVNDVSANSRAPCHFPFSLYGNVVPFCNTTMYDAEGDAWCALGVDEDGITCMNACAGQGESWDSCNDCTKANFTPEEESVSSCEPDQRRAMEGELCVFPFVYNGKSYTDCTADPYDTWLSGFYPPTRPWCALDGEAYLIGECAPCGDFEVSTSELEGAIIAVSKLCLSTRVPKVAALFLALNLSFFCACFAPPFSHTG